MQERSFNTVHSLPNLSLEGLNVIVFGPSSAGLGTEERRAVQDDPGTCEQPRKPASETSRLKKARTFQYRSSKARIPEPNGGFNKDF